MSVHREYLITYLFIISEETLYEIVSIFFWLFDLLLRPSPFPLQFLLHVNVVLLDVVYL